MKDSIAVLGIGCRLPGHVQSPDELWSALCAGKSLASIPPAHRWKHRRYFHQDKGIPGRTYAERASFITEDIHAFDAQFFGLSPREADGLDPQQKLLLEASWRAFEDAAVSADTLAASRTGVFIGGFMLDNLVLHLNEARRQGIQSQTALGVVMAMLANRISHTWDFRGPSLACDTACSSSLVAVDLAVRSLRSHQCDFALVGGVNVMLNPLTSVAMSKGGYLSPDGRSKAFDASANGYGRGEGALILLLCRADDAQKEGHRPYAQILNTGVNQDGHTPGVSYPSGPAQLELMQAVLQSAGIAPEQLHYMEAHGTGTAVGDPIEANSIGQLSQKPLLLGSSKAIFGHLEAAAGILGLAKASLILHHRKVPAHPLRTTPNPAIDFDGLGLRLPQVDHPLPQNEDLFVGVNSFGFGGTNAFALLSSAKKSTLKLAQEGPTLLPLSVADWQALPTLASAALEILESGESAQDLAATLARGRQHLPLRAALFGQDTHAIKTRLQTLIDGETHPNIVLGKGRVAQESLTWVFTGMGSQSFGMGVHLYQDAPVFRQAIDECASLFKRHADWPIADLFKGPDFWHSLTDIHGQSPKWGQPISRPSLAQVANLVLQVGLVRFLRDKGVEADQMVGHSVGEIAAAWASGALALDDALKLVAMRGRLLEDLAGTGGMIVIGLTPEETQKYSAGLDFAALNGPESTVLSGPIDALEVCEAALIDAKVFYRRLRVDIPYHSRLLDGIEGDYLAALEGLSSRPPKIPLISTVTGQWNQGDALDGAYWWRNMREPVRFSAAMALFCQTQSKTYLEIGPHPALAHCISAIHDQSLSLSTQRRTQNGVDAAWQALGSLYVAGIHLDSKKLWPEGRRTPIPKYPFQRQTFAPTRLPVESKLPLLSRRHSHADDAWEIDAGALTWVQDHQIGAEAWFPAMGCVVAALLGQDGPKSICNARFETACVVEVDTILALRYEGTRYGLYGKKGASGSWTRHAMGRLIPPQPAPNTPLDLETYIAQCPRIMVRDAVYLRLAAHGLNYGKAFQVIEEAHLGPLQGHARLRLNGADSNIDPRIPLLDGGGQLLRLIAPSIGHLVPVEFEKLEIWGELTGEIHVQAQVEKHGPLGFRGDIQWTHATGQILARLTGLSFQKVGDDPIQHTPWWKWEWVEAPENGDDTAIHSVGAFTVEGRNPLAMGLRSAQDASTSQAGCIFFLECENDALDLEALSGALPHLQNHNPAASQTFIAITRGAAPLDGAAINPTAAALWGLMRVAISEMPQRHFRCIDVDATTTLEALRAEILNGDAPEVALSGGKRWIPKWQKDEAQAQTIAPGDRVQLRALKPGMLGSLTWVKKLRRAPGPGEIEVKTRWAGIAFKDLLKAMGRLPSGYLLRSHGGDTLGFEGAGKVSRVGPGVSDFRVGDTVGCFPDEGAFQSHCTLSTSQAWLLPEHIPPEKACMMTNYCTAHVGLFEHAHLQKDETILIHSASGGLGLAALELAQKAGARIFATAGSDKKRAYLRSRGIKYVFDSRSSDFISGILSTCPTGIDVAIGSLHGDLLHATLEVLAPHGRLIDLGKLDALGDANLAMAAFDRSITYTSVDWDLISAQKTKHYRKTIDALTPILHEIAYDLPSAIHPAHDAEKALRRLQESDHIGKHSLDLTHAPKQAVPDPNSPTISEYGTYLITGGTGGLGAAFAHVLAQNGAGQIILISRRGA